MPENEARAWWVDVQHVRESIERRRGDAGGSTALAEPLRPAEPLSPVEHSWSSAKSTSTAPADLTPWMDLDGRGTPGESPDAAWLDAPAEGPRGRRFERAAVDEPPIPRLADLDWPPAPPGAGTRRVEHSARAERGDSTAALDEPRAARRRATRGA